MSKAQVEGLGTPRQGEGFDDIISRQAIEFAALALITRARAEGYNMTINMVSDAPLAMRNYHPVISVWKAR